MCIHELLDSQGQVALSAPLEVAVTSCGRRNIFSASQVIREWGAYPDLQQLRLNLPGGQHVPLLERNGLLGSTSSEPR